MALEADGSTPFIHPIKNAAYGWSDVAFLIVPRLFRRVSRTEGGVSPIVLLSVQDL